MHHQFNIDGIFNYVRTALSYKTGDEKYAGYTKQELGDAFLERFTDANHMIEVLDVYNDYKKFVSNPTNPADYVVLKRRVADLWQGNLELIMETLPQLGSR